MNTQSIRKASFVLVIGAALISLVLAACAPAPSQPATEAASPSVEAPQAVQRVTLEESKSAFDSGAAVFVDVRDGDVYATSHIPGALSIPLAEIEARIAELGPQQWIITYCT